MFLMNSIFSISVVRVYLLVVYNFVYVYKQLKYFILIYKK